MSYNNNTTNCKKQKVLIDSRNLQQGHVSNGSFRINPYVYGSRGCYINKIYIDSLPNINENNNTSQIIFNNVLYNISIPVGYYTPSSIITPLQNAIATIPGLTCTIVLNSLDGILTFTFNNNVILPYSDGGNNQYLFKTLQVRGFNQPLTNIYTSSSLPNFNGNFYFIYSRTIKISSSVLSQFNLQQVNTNGEFFPVYNNRNKPGDVIEVIFTPPNNAPIQYEPFNDDMIMFSRDVNIDNIDIALWNDRNQLYLPTNTSGSWRIELILLY